MKKNKFLFIFIFITMFIIPVSVLAGGGSDDKGGKSFSRELPVPDFSVTFVKDYSEIYSCKYRLNFSDLSPIWQGSFDFVINFSKLGGAKSITVSQASSVADWTDMNISKLATTNSISKNIYFESARGHYCPALMAYVSEENDKKTGKKIGRFTVKEYNSAEYNKNQKKASINIWYILHSFNNTAYNCQYKNKEECNKNQYCNWVVIDRGHDEYSCKEKKYGTTTAKPEPDKTRTEACSGYEEKIFNQSIEYSFSVDKVLNVSHSGGDFSMFGGYKFIDKNNQLYDLWKEGKCCTKDKLGVNFSSDTAILSCDGSESNWDYESPEDESGELQLGGVVTGCEVIPEVIRKWINNILKFVRYVALALVIALGAIDFMKAAGSGEPDAMKKSGQSFMKRMIAVVILFLLPVIVDFILNMVNIYGVDPNNIDCL